MAKNKYKYYACLKDGHNGGLVCDGRDSAQAAGGDLLELVRKYLNNDIVFMGIIKCADGRPFHRIKDLNT